MSTETEWWFTRDPDTISALRAVVEDLPVRSEVPQIAEATQDQTRSSLYNRIGRGALSRCIGAVDKAANTAVVAAVVVAHLLNIDTKDL